MPRPRTPVKLLKLRNTYRADRHQGREGEELQVPALERLPQCPRRLKGEARKLWKTIGERLIAEGILAALDLDVLEDLCMVQARLREAEANVERFGSVLVNTAGSMYQSPWVSIMNKTRQQLASLRAQFGMTPAARCKVKPAAQPVEEPDPDGIARFFRKPAWEQEDDEETKQFLDVIERGGA
jgi:P27 family predicted phage terminase small subunit